MMQFLADQLDQMDLAIDQLALKDRNFDRFAMMLVDNVVELTLHQHAEDKGLEAQMWHPDDGSRYEPKIVAAALGPRFDEKVKLARLTEMISGELADTFLYLHTFRNTAYHRGVRHEGILHSLTLFYFKCACALLGAYSPMWWSTGTSDQISHRASKYLGKIGLYDMRDRFQDAWNRLLEVAASWEDALVVDLRDDLERTIQRVDDQIDFLVTNTLGATRDGVIVDSQVWTVAYSDEGKAFAENKGGPSPMAPEYVAWIGSNYPFTTVSDPIPSWRKRLQSLASERSPHVAIKKYCDFLNQTEKLRFMIDASAMQLDDHIQRLVDSAREEDGGPFSL